MRRIIFTALALALLNPTLTSAQTQPKSGSTCPRWGEVKGKALCVQVAPGVYVWGAVPSPIADRLRGVPTPTAAPTPATAPSPASAAGPRDVIPEGTHLVNVDVRPGVYRANPLGSESCYADTEDRAGTILEQEVGSGSVILRVDARAYSVTNRRCGPMTRIGD
jgi:hypothetical protein